MGNCKNTGNRLSVIANGFDCASQPSGIANNPGVTVFTFDSVEQACATFWASPQSNRVGEEGIVPQATHLGHEIPVLGMSE